MKTKSSDSIWVVVRSSSGIPDLAEVYTDYASAEKREQRLVKTMNEERDGIAVIQTKLKPAKR